MSGTTLAAWKKAAVHDITLPSGMVVKFKVPDLPALIKSGQIPNNLIDASLAAVQGTTKVDRQFVIEQGEFVNKIVALSIVEPAITEDEAAEVPVEDRELIAELASRQRDLDALGHHISGLHTNKDFRTFRGLGPGDEDVEDLYGR